MQSSEIAIDGQGVETQAEPPVPAGVSTTGESEMREASLVGLENVYLFYH